MQRVIPCSILWGRLVTRVMMLVLPNFRNLRELVVHLQYLSAAGMLQAPMKVPDHLHITVKDSSSKASCLVP